MAQNTPAATKPSCVPASFADLFVWWRSRDVFVDRNGADVWLRNADSTADDFTAHLQRATAEDNTGQQRVRCRLPES